MADEIRTSTSVLGLARRVGQFEIEDVYVYLEHDPRLRFYIPKRWWTSERFDINVNTDPPNWEPSSLQLPFLEVDVGRKQIRIYRPTHRINPISLALLVECLAFARDVLAEA